MTYTQAETNGQFEKNTIKFYYNLKTNNQFYLYNMQERWTD